MTNFNLNFLILTFPIALNGLILGPFNPKLLFVQMATLFLAELARQWLWGENSTENIAPPQKRFFFFGTVYNNSTLERFFSPRSLEGAQTQPKKIVLFGITYAISFLSIRYAVQFANFNPLHLFIISTITSFWIFCKTPEQINRLLLLNLFINTLIVLNRPLFHFLPFFLWFLSHFFISFTSQKLVQQKEGSDKNFQTLFSLYDLKRSIMTAFTLCILFVIFNTAIPQYSKDGETNSALHSEAPLKQSRSSQKAKLLKKTNVSPETLTRMAQLKTEVEKVDLNRLSVDFKNKSISIQPPESLSTEIIGDSNMEDLQYLSEQLKKNKTLTAEELKKLNELAKNIKYEEQQWKDANSHPETQPPNQNTAEEAFKKYEKAVQDLNKEIQKSTATSASNKIETFDKNEITKPLKPPQESDLVQEYNDARNQVAKQVDQLMNQQQKNMQLKEEMKILSLFDRLHKNSLKLVLLFVLFIILIYVLSRKRLWSSSQQKKQAKQISLPREVRRRLKDIYKALLASRLSPSEEVLKTYYLVEMAMNEIDFPRSEDLPPQNYFEIVNSKFPFLGAPVKVATELFNRVFYGEKTPNPQEITSLRVSLKELLRKLQVI